LLVHFFGAGSGIDFSGSRKSKKFSAGFVDGGYFGSFGVGGVDCG
jgi:hypothetical protein